MPVSLNAPMSLFSIPVAWYTGMIPHMMKMVVVQKAIGYNNLQPRTNTKLLVEDTSVPREVVECVQRLEGAHQNDNETLPLWIGAVLAGNMAGITNKTMNITSTGFIATRMLYNYVYCTQSSVAVSWIRSVLYFTSIGFPMYLIIKAGNIMRKAH